MSIKFVLNNFFDKINKKIGGIYDQKIRKT